MKILYAEDDARYRELVKVFLEPAGFDVTTVNNGQEAMEYLADNNDVDLVLLDILMPIMNGREVCSELRKISDIPIIMLTALDDDRHEVKGLQSGADDYISKPFPRDVLLARINSLTRRIRMQKVNLFSEEGFVFHEDQGIVIHDNREVALSPKESLLLQYLLKNKNCVVSREQILDKVWGRDFYGDHRTVDTRIKNIRAKLESLGDRIKTVRGQGYYYKSDTRNA